MNELTHILNSNSYEFNIDILKTYVDSVKKSEKLVKFQMVYPEYWYHSCVTLEEEE